MSKLLKPRLLIMGYGDHGKDSACKLLNDLSGLSSVSSSWFANETIVYPAIKDKYGYKTAKECYDDRRNLRDVWFELIKAYNTPDGARLARQLYSQFNIYNGIRNIEEFTAIKEAKLFDKAIWIDACLRKPIEDKRSCTVSPEDADIIVDNNGSEAELRTNLELVMPFLFN